MIFKCPFQLKSSCDSVSALADSVSEPQLLLPQLMDVCTLQHSFIK